MTCPFLWPGACCHGSLYCVAQQQGPALPLAKGFPQLCQLLGRPGLCGMSSTPELCCGDRRKAATVFKIPHNPRWLPRGF